MQKDIDRSSPVPVKRSMRFTIPSDFEFSREVQEQIMAEVEKHGYCESAHFAIKLGLEEAMVNAIKHGNQFSSTKKVYIKAEVGPQQTRIIIEDEGKGFDRDGVPDPRRDENLEKCCGRGILLIEAYMTRVHWSNKGRRCTMFRVNEPDSPSAHCRVNGQ